MAKARYSTPSGLTPEDDESMSDAERNEINTLMVENEELKKEVSGGRPNPAALPLVFWSHSSLHSLLRLEC